MCHRDIWAEFELQLRRNRCCLPAWLVLSVCLDGQAVCPSFWLSLGVALTLGKVGFSPLRTHRTPRHGDFILPEICTLCPG